MNFTCKALIAGILTVSASQAAVAEETVRFTFEERELETAPAREQLLERIELVSARSCKQTSSLLSLSAKTRCADSITAQIVEKIGNQALSSLASSKSDDVYRSASS